MSDEIQIQYCDANELADALINDEVSLVSDKLVTLHVALS